MMLKRVALFLALVLPVFMISIDMLVIGVAVAPMAKTFQVAMSTVQWFITAYAVGYAAFVGASGRVSEMVGKKTFLISGLLIFIITSFVISIAGSASIVILARVLQGVSAGIMSTTSISIVMSTFESKHEQAVWVGALVGVSGLGMALGPPVGGILVHYFGWPSVFVINIPIGMISILAGCYAIKPYPRDTNQRLDLIGLVLLATTIFCLVLLVSQGYIWGVGSPLFIAFVAIFVVACALLFYRESHSQYPLLDLSLFKSINFTPASIAAFTVYFIFLGQILIWGIYLAKSAGLDPLQIGMHLLPLGLMIAVGSIALRGAIKKITGKNLMLIGASLSLISSLWLGLMPLHFQYWELAIGLACLGLGFFLVNSISTNVALGLLPQQQISFGSSMSMMLRWLGGSFGSAISSVVFMLCAKHALSNGPYKIILKKAISAHNPRMLLESIPAHTRLQSQHDLLQALHHGLVRTQWVFAGVSLVVAITTFVFIKSNVVAK